MPLICPKPGIVDKTVGRTPWSARIPLEPLFAQPLQPRRSMKSRSARFWSTRDMSKMQSPDEGDQRPHLPQAAEMEVSEVRQGQDAEAKVTGEFSLLRAHRLLM